MPDTTSNTVIDTRKRTFLKVAGVVGLSTLASLALPKKASAAYLGGAVNSGVLGVKDSTNARINPATDEKLDSILSQLQSKADSNQTQPVSIPSTINVVVAGGLTANEVKLTDSADMEVNPFSEDSTILLRRMVKLMESQATVDSANRQRVSVDAWGENIDAPLLTGTATGPQSLTALVDTTQYNNWLENKWSYFAVKIISGTGAGQIRIIVSNTSTVLTLQNPWTVLPDNSSVYGIYDVWTPAIDKGVATRAQGLLTLTDTTKSWSANIWINYAVKISGGLDGVQIRLITSNTSNTLTYNQPWMVNLGITPTLDTGIALGDQSMITLVDTAKTWNDNMWTGFIVQITSGAGIGQVQVIASNTSNTLTLQNLWAIQPDVTSTYSICTLPIDAKESGSASNWSDIRTFVDSAKNWTTDTWANYLIKVTSGLGAGQVRAIVSNTATVLTISDDWLVLPNSTSTYAIYLAPTREYTIFNVPSTSTDVGTIASGPRLALGTDSTVGAITNANSFDKVGSYAAQQRFGDISHKVYNNSIRRQLTFN